MSLDNAIEINVDGVVIERQEAAKQDLINQFKPLVDSLKISIKVIVTKNFNVEINNILRQQSGLETNYSQKRNHCFAVAKTIPFFDNENARFVIVLDANTFGRWEETDFSRRQVLSHESIHLIDELLLFKELGINIFKNPFSSVEAFKLTLAFDIWMEYHAERFSIEWINNAIKTVAPEAIITYGLHEKFMNSLEQSVKSLPDFLAQNTEDFANREIGIEKLWSDCYLRLRETLILAALVTSQLDATSRVNQTHEFFQDDYSFFSSRWSEIHNHMQTLYQTENKFDKDVFDDIGDELITLFENCGLRLSNVDEGIYVAVENNFS